VYYFICISYDVIKIQFNVSGPLQIVAEHYRALPYVHEP